MTKAHPFFIELFTNTTRAAGLNATYNAIGTEGCSKKPSKHGILVYAKASQLSASLNDTNEALLRPGTFLSQSLMASCAKMSCGSTTALFLSPISLSFGI